MLPIGKEGAKHNDKLFKEVLNPNRDCVLTSCAGYKSTWQAVQRGAEAVRRPMIIPAKTADVAQSVFLRHEWEHRFRSACTSTVNFAARHPSVTEAHDFSFMM